MSLFEFLVGEERIESSVVKKDDSLIVVVGKNQYVFKPIGDNLFQVTGNGATHIVAAVKYRGIVYVDIDSTLLEVREASDIQSSFQISGQAAVKDKVFAPMPGKIVKVLVSVGDSVMEKQPLAVVEAMKMENQIYSPANGIVKAVNFSAGQQVNTTTPIIELELEQQ